jgi:syringomycin synthetase protein SyrE
LETANCLQREGIEVRGLFLIDTIYPSRLWGGTALWRLTGWLVKRLHIQDLSMNGRRLGAMLGDAGLISQVMAVSGYRANKFAGLTHLIKSAALAAKLDRLLFLGWRLMLGRRLLEYTVQGLHGSMFDPANVSSLAKVIRVATTKEQPTLGHSDDFPVRHG